MTSDQRLFLDNINRVYFDKVVENIQKRNYSTSDRVLEEYKTILRYIYTYLLNDYFNVISASDFNFYTESDAEDIINRLNELNNTSYWVTTEITDYAVSANVWDDTYIWDDENIWRD